MKMINLALESAADGNLKPRDPIERTFVMTQKIKDKFKIRDGTNKEGKFKGAIKLGKEIRKDIKKARHSQRIDELKEKLWYDIKNIKKGF